VIVVLFRSRLTEEAGDESVAMDQMPAEKRSSGRAIFARKESRMQG
jgi:hypothetical protein